MFLGVHCFAKILFKNFLKILKIILTFIRARKDNTHFKKYVSIKLSISEKFLRKSKMDKNFPKKMSKIKIPKKVLEKKVFFYRNKSKNFFSVLRAFSRKITFFVFFPKNQKKVQKMDIFQKWTFLGFFSL